MSSKHRRRNKGGQNRRNISITTDKNLDILSSNEIVEEIKEITEDLECSDTIKVVSECVVLDKVDSVEEDNVEIREESSIHSELLMSDIQTEDLKSKESKENKENKVKKDSNLEKENNKPKKKELTKKQKIIQYSVFGFLVLISIFAILLYSDSEPEQGTMSYIDFLSYSNKGYIDEIVYSESSPFVDVYFKEDMGVEEVYDEETGKIIEYDIVNGRRHETVLNPSDDDFYKNASLNGANVTIASNNTIQLLVGLVGVIPTIILIVLIFWMVKMQFGGGMKDPTGKVSQKSSVKFSDVAGMTEEKEELLFAINSLQNREEYVKRGVRPIKGILLEGPPGVGKTLLAKAVAGEAGVNFLSYSGSDFVEMFVGLGARRVRTMCETAEKLKPCVVFIDEIDALGRKRVSGGNGGTQEADQTLVALLERMDGLNTTSGILFIAATNRVDALDNALLRPGRFDKTIHVSPPKTKEDRVAIIKVHSKDKTFAEGVTEEDIAKQMYGLTGAEIASALNDAVLESFKADKGGIIDLSDIDKAIMKLYAKGLAKGRHSSSDKSRVAIHETGHALMNKHLGRNVVKVSIQPYTSGIGGVTQIDGESSGIDGLQTKTDIINDIKVLYAGKVAEEVMLGECSVGASNDLERATYLLRDYVGAYGMQEDNLLSLVGLGRDNLMIAANENLLSRMRETANSIYLEVKTYFSNDEVKKKLQKIADILCENEVIYDFDAILMGIDSENEVLLGKQEKDINKFENESEKAIE